MKKKLKTILNYITRGWSNENNPPTHSGIKIIPPFLFDLLGLLILIVVIISIIKALFI